MEMSVAINRAPLQEALDRFRRITAHLEMDGRDSTYFRAAAYSAISSRALARIEWHAGGMVVQPGQRLLDLLALYPEVK